MSTVTALTERASEEPETREASVSPRVRSRTTVVEPTGAGPASTVAERLGRFKPVPVFFTTMVVGYALLAAALVALGLVLTRVLLPIDAVQRADEWAPAWLASHRSVWLTDASAVGSRIGDVPVLPALVALTLIVAAVIRRFRIGVFLLTAILMEVTLYRVGALAVPRERPDVTRLDALPIDESFPSGHVAASLVVYFGLALVVSSVVRCRWVSTLCWTLAAAIVVGVATSRVYRGMHHPLDVLAGALLGVGCLVVALVAVRAYGWAKRMREGHAEQATGECRVAT
jgi:undecaprenyl-diphosphatase